MKNKYPIRAKNETGDVTVDVQEFVVPDSAITAGSGYVNLATATGDVTGPSSATDNAAAVFDSTTGKVIKDGSAVNVLQKRAVESFTTTATAAGTTTLTVDSNPIQVFTGTTTQTVTLPVVTTLPKTGFRFTIINNSTGLVTVNSSGSNAVQPIAQGGSAVITCVLLTGTTAASWDSVYVEPSTGVFDIRYYGAKMDGTTNDLPAFKLAFDAAVAAGGGTVYVPQGNTVFSGDPGAFTGASTYPNITILGANGSNVTLSSAPYLWFGNLGVLRFENLTFIGGATATMQSADRIFQLGYCQQAVMNNCRFYGLGSTGADALGAVVLFYNSPGVMTNCYFVGCSAPSSGVVTSNGGVGFAMQGCRFIDIGEYRGISYSTAQKTACYSWLRLSGLDNITGANYKSASIDNCLFDEAPLWGIRFDGTSVTTKYTLNITNTSFNCGNDRGAGVFTAAIYASYAGLVQLDTVYAGFVNNATDYSFAEFTNCDAVEMTKVVGLYGASYVTFSGTTSRVKLRNCTLAGFVTYPLGWNNSAGAYIDADTAMEDTASATALAPLGRTTHITGTTAVTSITATNFRANDELRLIFDDAVTFTDGNNLKLAGNFSTGADDTISLVFDGTNFYETARSVN